MAHYKLTPKGKARVVRNCLAASCFTAVGDGASAFRETRVIFCYAK